MKENEWNQATILYNTVYGVKERQERLAELAGKTHDMKLKKQMEERIRYEIEAERRFDSNADGKYIYIVMLYAHEENDYEPTGYFKNYEVAESYGRSKQKEFHIEKYEIVDQILPKQPSDIRLNPNLFSKEEIAKEEAEKEYDGSAVGAKHFDADGQLQYIFTHEMRDEEEKVDAFRCDRFEHRFVEVEYSFHRGDFVKIKGSDGIGIIETSREEYNAIVKRYKEGLYLDWFDSMVKVQFLDKNGAWGHEHVHPVLLEPVLPEEIAEECRSLYEATGSLIAGEGCLDTFLLLYEEYKKNYTTG